MATSRRRYSDLIRGYCEARSIQIPIGFKGKSASRYAIIYLEDPPRLVARTWTVQADVVYYLNNLAKDVPMQILDFKEGVEMIYKGGNHLHRDKPFMD